MGAHDDLIDRYFELFQGNNYAYGTEDGGCMRRVNAGSPDEARWGQKGIVAGHLSGNDPPIGIYPMVLVEFPDKWMVHWGCVDFDEGEEESWVHASNVHKALAAFGIEGWIERSRSKGYHVWVFCKEWADAQLVREALLAACQLVEAPTKEINPKQTELKQKPDGTWQLGNYVRLPYPGHLAPKHEGPPDYNRRVVLFVDGTASLSLETFVQGAWECRVSVDRLEALAAHYEPPQAPFTPKRDWGDTVLEGDAVSRLAGKSLVIFSEGPLEGSGRGHTLFKLARYLKEDGRHSYEEATELVRDADSRWGKFHDRPDGEVRLKELLDRAWS